MKKEERAYLLKKYLKICDLEEANKRINKFISHLKELKTKLRIQKKSKEDISKIFKKEHEKLLLKLEKESR